MTDSPYGSPEQLGQTAASNGKGCGWLTIAVSTGIVLLLISLILPALHRGVPETARRVQCQNNLKQIVLALHNYNEEYDTLPPAFTVDETGKPLHSWRTLILPFLDQKNLYNSIDLSKPWDASVNQEAGESRPPTFACPSSDLPEGFTTYMAIVGEDYAFHPKRSRTLSEFTDGTSNTLMVMEVPITSATHWMDPKDAPPSFLLSERNDAELTHRGGTHIALADGHVHFFSSDSPLSERRSMLTISADDHSEEESRNSTTDTPRP